MVVTAYRMILSDEAIALEKRRTMIQSVLSPIGRSSFVDPAGRHRTAYGAAIHYFDETSIEVRFFQEPATHWYAAFWTSYLVANARTDLLGCTLFGRQISS
jgi:hypothetical protein